MFRRIFTPPCLCSTTDRRVLCSIVSLLHHVYIQPLSGGFYVPSCLYSTMSIFNHCLEGSMFRRVFTPPCLCSTTDRRFLCSIVPLVHHVYAQPLTGGFYVPLCL